MSERATAREEATLERGAAERPGARARSRASGSKTTAAARPQLLGAAVFLALSVLLLLPIYLPAAEAVALSPRSERGVPYVVRYALEPADLGEIALPNLDLNMMADAYLGPAALACALYALFVVGRRREQAFWLALAALAVVLSLGKHTPVLPFFADHVPGFGLFRAAMRHLGIYAFAVAIAAAHGVGALARGEGSTLARVALAVLAAAWIALAVARAPVVTLVAGGASLAFLCAAAFDRHRARYHVVGAAVLVLADLWTSGASKIYRLHTPPRLAADLPLLARTPGVDGPWRMHNEEVLRYHVPYLHDVREISGYGNPIKPQRQELVMRRLAASIEAHDPRGRGGPFTAATAALLERMNVRWLWTRRRIPPSAGAAALGDGLYELGRPVAIARVYPRAAVLPAPQVLARLADPTPLEEALIEPEDRPAELPASSFTPVDGRIVRYRRNEVEVEVSPPAPGILVLAENAYPGWRADVNGRPVPIFRASYLHRAVLVPGGPSLVTFRFSPNGFWALYAAFAVGLAGASALALRRDRRG